MVDAMRDEDWYNADRYTGDGIGLARIDLQIIDVEPQPLWSVDGNIALVMAGEIYSWDGELAAAGSASGAELPSNPALLLAAYLHYGEQFIQHVNGSFVAALWHVRERRLLLVNDHIGSYPLYYAHIGSHLVFGSGARAVAQAPDLPRKVNTAAMAELLTFEHTLGQSSLFVGVDLLPAATLLRFENGSIACTTYDDFQFPDYYEYHNEDYYTEQWAYYVRQAVARQTRGPQPLGMLLTGGLDSRTLLAMMDLDAVDVVAMTFGQPNCDDARYAREVARALHVPHLFFLLPPDYLRHLAAKGVRITDGLKSCVHMNMLGALDQVTHEAQVLYKGYLGGTIYGYVVSHDRLTSLREDDWFALIFQSRNRLFRPDQFAQLYSSPMQHEVADAPFVALRQALSRSHSACWVDKDNYIDLYEEDRRFTILGVELARSRALVRVPLIDKDLLRFTFRVPIGLRVDERYYRRAFARAFPQLAKIPSTATGLPLTPCFRDLSMQANMQVRWWLRRHGLPWLPVPTARPYADYASWLRGPLRSWVEEILLSPLALERGYFQPAFVKNLVSEHMVGDDHARRLGMLLTIELWHRQFID